MAYISPNSSVRLLRGVPIDRDYNHTKYHTIGNNMAQNIVNQYNSFNSFYHLDFSEQSYQRSGRNKIRLAISINMIYDMNYMIFKNRSHEDKYYYAFIDSIEYVNENTCEISYTLDIMQTWYFDYDLADCYVEREHTLTDNIGDNLIPENIDTGELIIENKDEYLYTRKGATIPLYKLVILYVPNSSKQYIAGYTYNREQDLLSFTFRSCEITGYSGRYDTGTIVNGIYSGCKYITIDLNVDSSTYINETRMIIDSVVDKILGTEVGGRIVGMVQVPYGVWNDWINTAYATPTEKVIELTNYFRKAGSTGQPQSDEFYVPRNKKLYTYPYRCIVLSNNAGQTATYKWELSSDSGDQYFLKKIKFNIEGTPVTTPEVMCYPKNYRGITLDYESGLILNDFPMPSWSEDSFAKWWTQNKDAYISSIIASSIAFLGSIAATAVTAGASSPLTGTAAAGVISSAIGIGTSAAGKIASNVGTFMTAKNTPDQIGGQSSISSLRTIQNRIGYYFYDMGVERSKAISIDNYFTMFGYAIKAIKKPNVRVQGATLRPYFNYIKTANCLVHAVTGYGLPAEDEEKIVKIYNNGITFWTDFNYFGDYSVPNQPQ